ncbi:MAG: CDP-alcohol phosphatidyltransferase family protein [Oscillospiraceae bacterium]|nr:CDP-alcohol phosphatidyltransferase family protein [Oscillospiraceae bacterium]
MHINWKKEIFTVPNLLSFIRLLLIPVYLHFYLYASTSLHYWLSGFILSVSCMTDAIDGMIARKFNMISNFGKLLDPLADKLTQFSLTICLARRYPALNPVLALFVAKECFQLFAVIMNFRQGKVLPGALPAGKVCTAVLFVSLILLVVLPGLSSWYVNLIALINAVFLTFAFANYVLAFYGKQRKLEDFHTE